MAWVPEEGCWVHRHLNGLQLAPAEPGDPAPWTLSLTIPQLITQRHRLSPGAQILLPAGPHQVHGQEPVDTGPIADMKQCSGVHDSQALMKVGS